MTYHRLARLAVLVAGLLVSEQCRQFLHGQEKGVHVSIALHPVNGARFSPEIVADRDGTLRLAHSVLLTDETGATDYRQTETLSARMQARKIIRLESAEVAGAELLLYGQAKEIAVNGKSLGKSEPLGSTAWTRVTVPAQYLKAGENEFDFSGGGSLLIEPGKPGHSFKSRDGGKTWSADELGNKNTLRGEYLVRLRLGRYAPHGWWMSPVIELWRAPIEEVRRPWKTTLFKAPDDLNKEQPEGTQLTAWLRTGDTPAPDDRTWTNWRKLDRNLKTDETTAEHRWAQLKLELMTTRAQATPRIRNPHLEVLGIPPREDALPKKGTVRIVLPTSGEVELPGAVSSVPFVYETPSPRLKLLCEKYQLDKVIAPGKTEMEQLMLLRFWVRNQCHRGWASHPALWIPPWDALLILDSRDRPDCLVMCTHFSCVFTQCCLALGWNARHCILDHHCVSEVWVDHHRKWVMMDTGNSADRADVGLHFERGGVPLSARELQAIYRSGKSEGVKVCFTPARLCEKIATLCRPAPAPRGKLLPRPDVIPLAELPKYPVCQINNYRRYAFPPRNNFLTTLYPGELEHGFSNYFYDGYCWVGDSADEPSLSPEYSRHLSPERPQDIDWDLNWLRIHLSQTAKPGELQVDVEEHVPNLVRLEKDTTGSARGASATWQKTSPRFTWKLKPGMNELRVRGLNHWGRGGAPSQVQVEWKPGS